MIRTSRRGFLGAASAVAVGGLSLRPSVAGSGSRPSEPYRVITDLSEQYDDLRQGTNLRWKGSPKRIAFPKNAEDVAHEVALIRDTGLVPAVRSGGHCYEDFVSNGRVTAIIDTSAMNQVSWDPNMKAFEVGAGAQLGAVYQLLYKQWGVYVPAGNCPTVAAGGHIAGGGYGSMNRRDGLVVDHLHAVEVVHMRADGSVAISRGTRDPNDPHHDLWWAYTGGGGGNFGIATRYWLRSPQAIGDAPETALPRPPRHVWISTVSWNWDTLDEAAFKRLMTNHAKWHEKHSAPDAPETALFSQLKTWHRTNGAVTMDTIVDDAAQDAAGMLARYVQAVSDGVGAPAILQERRVPWMQATQWAGFTGPDPTRRFDGKSAYLKRAWTDEMLSAAYAGLTDPRMTNPVALLMIASYGGAVNSIAPEDTAVAQRDSIIKFQVVSIWDDPEKDAENIAWTRNTYAGMFASSGGVPVPNGTVDGAFINYCDTDLDDPRFNRSELSSFDLYYKQNFSRLQKVRNTYDPKEFFRHGQSIPLT
ncbi:FAD/FMN-containing dehydrogenase [Roseibium hamelinense]|uniref:FAD/FMN-containing dehydrogenase n=1 Tax=Roseibium hamelinense TaxID=150831 RepID=A0A562TJ13_9HYPH|nr:FAD/FMN-containing dehydrogenase [Roseibium hamelinense]